MRVALLLPVIVVGTGFIVFCLVDLVRARQVRYLPKWVWVLICLVSVPIGGIVYLSIGRVRWESPS